MEFSGLKLEIFQDVYEPAEDSFMLAKHAQNLQGKVLEIGCGCGIASLACAKSSPKNTVLGVDINPKAVLNSIANAKSNRIQNAKFRKSDLFSSVYGKFDCIMFNPPYLPTSEKEKLRGKLNNAFDGGKNGRKVTDKFLKLFLARLKKDGTLLLVESSLAGIEKTLYSLKHSGFKATILEEQKFFFERLVLIQARKKQVHVNQRTI